MMNYCPVCKSPLHFLENGGDFCGDQYIWQTTLACNVCNMTIEENETYQRVSVTAEYFFQEDEKDEV